MPELLLFRSHTGTCSGGRRARSAQGRRYRRAPPHPVRLLPAQPRQRGLLSVHEPAWCALQHPCPRVRAHPARAAGALLDVVVTERSAASGADAAEAPRQPTPEDEEWAFWMLACMVCAACQSRRGAARQRPWPLMCAPLRLRRARATTRGPCVALLVRHRARSAVPLSGGCPTGAVDQRVLESLVSFLYPSLHEHITERHALSISMFRRAPRRRRGRRCRQRQPRGRAAPPGFCSSSWRHPCRMRWVASHHPCAAPSGVAALTAVRICVRRRRWCCGTISSSTGEARAPTRLGARHWCRAVLTRRGCAATKCYSSSPLRCCGSDRTSCLRWTAPASCWSTACTISWTASRSRP
jgi:hypothetical protein